MPIPRSEYLSTVWKDDIFAGRVAFVTGGAGTICSAQTRALVYLGANACILGRNVEKTEAAAKDIATARPGAKVLGIGGCDVRDPESLKTAAERCAKELGAIDFVIAGAAGNFVAPMSGLSANGFKTVMDIDVLGTFNTIKATMPYLIESAKRNKNPSDDGLTGGRIIYVSASFHYTGTPLQSHVSAAKAAIDSLMASVSLEYGPYGVTSNVITPGGIANTEGMARLSSSKMTQKQIAAGVPIGRYGTIRDIADATVYLFSDAGNYVNGEVLVVDGAAWRLHNGAGVGLDADMKYPDFILRGEFSKHVKTGRMEKAKL
ncbi:peroxisomal 2,4-dienoyl-CoA reductase SPS19 [Pseudomassariella vexata]|uniref:2,4-dienoyl-CoA reductase [(3E)-enoyl-CoA-producing] n=1 Tax=Pseudomassariella vexata TaxID=1141098 RepID=A0A1Y2E4D0_9PEZI|nr:peroxisomal 2,4-dienoyl-CoA reductase SPS19 [Pseudomassariella vexata]ORY66411.1 peroxisomal 2,4-dienoyl-CoA reductase SPS19 [Pseudomassariella vexata]